MGIQTSTKPIFWLLFLVLLISLTPAPPTQATSLELPIGGILLYSVTNQANVQYQFHRWVTEINDSVLEVIITYTFNNTLVEKSCYYVLPQWGQIHPNGTPGSSTLFPPLWVDTSSMQEGESYGLYLSEAGSSPFTVQDKLEEGYLYAAWELAYSYDTSFGFYIGNRIEHTLQFDATSGILLRYILTVDGRTNYCRLLVWTNLDVYGHHHSIRFLLTLYSLWVITALIIGCVIISKIRRKED